MNPPKQAIERVARAATHPHFYNHQFKKMKYATRNSRRINLSAADEVVPTTGGGKAKASRKERQKETDECTSSAVRKSVEGAGELWTFLEMGDESEAKHDIKGETEDEDEWDPNNLVDKLAHKQLFSRLFNNPHEGLNASKWKQRNKNKRCERCSTRDLPCTSKVQGRKLVCGECSRTHERKCSRLDEFRKESIKEKMGLDEVLWEELMKEYVVNKGRKATHRRKEMGRRVGEAEEQETEERDELDSDDEPQFIVTSINGSGTQREWDRTRKAKACTAKKVKVEVVLNKTSGRGKSGTYKHAHANDLGSSRITNGQHDIATSKVGLPATIHGLPDVMMSTSTSLQPLAAEFALPDLIETSPTLPPEASLGTDPPRPPPADLKAFAPETSANISASTSEPKNTVLVPPYRSISQTQNITGTPSAPQPPPSRRLIPPELSLRVLKRALEDISSDLRYRRIDERSAMVKFDDVADRIGRRAALCLGSGVDSA
ncbi:hypothetical protein AAF712_010913 [Marasmius tenuissimus]|uniref:Zn(2)-C6 fungal-type domain-containing protein n=1 Tax=Marasmius tenuissimus TaxID=585030 RepID=A0ABR2ZKY3_9AGAR